MYLYGYMIHYTDIFVNRKYLNNYIFFTLVILLLIIIYVYLYSYFFIDKIQIMLYYVSTIYLKKKGGLYMEDTRARIKTVIAAEQTTLKDVVNIMNENHPDDTTTPQNVTNKLARKTIRFDEVSEMMDIMNYDIIFRNRTTGKEF